MSTNRNDEIDNWFTHHPPTEDDTVRKYEHIRSHGRELAVCIDSLVPDGTEKDEAIKRIREAVMWANAGIACGG